MALGRAGGEPAGAREMLIRCTVGVALQAESARVSEKVVRVAALYDVACDTSLPAYRFGYIVVIDERPFFVSVASEAEIVSLGD